MPKKRHSTGFGSRLKALRERIGITPADLGKRVGITGQAVREFESGRHEPAWGVVLLLAAVLEVPLDAFRDPERDPQPADPNAPPSKRTGRPRTRPETQGSPRPRGRPRKGA